MPGPAKVKPEPTTTEPTKAWGSPRGEGADTEGGPLYHFFASEDGATESPAEVHQASFHFILHPDVPTLYKLKYLLMSISVIALQTFSICALLVEVDEMSATDVLSMYLDMHTFDWFMHLVLCLLIGFVVHAESEQTQIAGVMIAQAVTSEDETIRKGAMWWSLPLYVIVRVRQHILVPLTVCTAPILAIEGGLEAMDVALNVMAILFIFDLDDGALTFLCSRAQRSYLETVEIPLDAREQSRQGFQVAMVAFCAFTSTLLPIMLYDPNAIFCGRSAENKFAGVFSEGEPLKTNALISGLAFGVMGLLQLLHRLVRDRKDSSAALFLLVWDAIVTLAIVVACIYIGLKLGDIVHYESTCSESTERMLSEAGSGPPPADGNTTATVDTSSWTCNLPPVTSCSSRRLRY